MSGLASLKQFASSAGSKLATQIKANIDPKSNSSSVAATPRQPTQASDDSPLLQSQNRALRDRLRAAADENERLKDHLQRMHTGTASQASDTPGEGVTPLASPRPAGLAAENERLAEQLRKAQAAQQRAEEQAAQAAATAAAQGQQEAAALRSQLAHAVQRADAAETRHAAAETAASQARSALDELMTSTAAGEAAARAQTDALHAELAEQRAAVDRLQGERRQLADEKAAALSAAADVDILRAAVGALEAELLRTQQAQQEAVSLAAAAKEDPTAAAAVEGAIAAAVAAAHEEAAAVRAELAMTQQAVTELQEKLAKVKESLTDARAEAAARVESAKEEAGWLRQGAEELQRQLDASRTEAAMALQQGEEQVMALQQEVAALKLAQQGTHAATQTEAEANTKPPPVMEESLSAEAAPAPPPAAAEGEAPPPPPAAATAAAAADHKDDAGLELMRGQLAQQLEQIAGLREHLTRVVEAASAREAAADSVERATQTPLPTTSTDLAAAAASSAPPSLPAASPAQQQSLSGDSPAIWEVHQATPPAAAPPLEPHHRRDPSYSSEIEPAEGLTTPAAAAVSPGRPPRPPTSPAVHASLDSNTAAVEAAAQAATVDALRRRVAVLEADLRDNEQTHALRDTAAGVLKEEIVDLRRQLKRGEVDLDYLKSVLVESFASGELSRQSHMLPVLARLLQFSPAEVERCQQGGTPPGSLFGLLGR